jgi:hypothetical protein
MVIVYTAASGWLSDMRWQQPHGWAVTQSVECVVTLGRGHQAGTSPLPHIQSNPPYRLQAPIVIERTRTPTFRFTIGCFGASGGISALFTRSAICLKISKSKRHSEFVGDPTYGTSVH